MSTNPKVSIVIAAYNAGKFLNRAIDSALSQKIGHGDVEVIVINDGSTDDTENIISGYGNTLVSLNQENKGVTSASNAGLKLAKGEYVTRLDADDYLHTDLLSITLDSIEGKEEYSCVYTDRYEVDGKTKQLKVVTIGKDNIFDMVACGILFRRSIFDEIGLYKNLLFEEYDLMLRFYERYKAFYVQKPLYYYVRHDLSITARNGYWRKGWDELKEVWGEDVLRKWVRIQVKSTGQSIFSTYIT